MRYNEPRLVWTSLPITHWRVCVLFDFFLLLAPQDRAFSGNAVVKRTVNHKNPREVLGENAETHAARTARGSGTRLKRRGSRCG